MGPAGPLCTAPHQPFTSLVWCRAFRRPPGGCVYFLAFPFPHQRNGHNQMCLTSWMLDSSFLPFIPPSLLPFSYHLSPFLIYPSIIHHPSIILRLSIIHALSIHHSSVHHPPSILHPSTIHHPSSVCPSSMHYPSIIHPFTIHHPSTIHPSTMHPPSSSYPSSIHHPSSIHSPCIIHPSMHPSSTFSSLPHPLTYWVTDFPLVKWEVYAHQ